jgi:hypothetical protein
VEEVEHVWRTTARPMDVENMSWWDGERASPQVWPLRTGGEVVVDTRILNGERFGQRSEKAAFSTVAKKASRPPLQAGKSGFAWSINKMPLTKLVQRPLERVVKEAEMWSSSGPEHRMNRTQTLRLRDKGACFPPTISDMIRPDFPQHNSISWRPKRAVAVLYLDLLAASAFVRFKPLRDSSAP